MTRRSLWAAHPSRGGRQLAILSPLRRPFSLLRGVRPEFGYLLAAVSIVVVAPLKLGWRAHRDGRILYMPDLFETLAASAGAAHGSQFVGAWSRLGLYHPGPLWFYWAAPFSALSADQPASLYFAALALVAVCSAATLVVVFRAVGPTSAILAALALMVAFHQLSFVGLAYPWNPTVTIMPVVLGLVSLAALATTGSTAIAFVGWLSASFVAQSHLGSFPLGGAMMAATVVALVVARRRRATTLHNWVLLGCLAVVPWLPVIHDQVWGEQNLGTVTKYLITGDVNERFPPEPASASLALTVPEVTTRYAAMATLSEQDTARWGGAEVSRGLAHKPSGISLAVMAGLLALLALGAIGSIRRTSVRFEPFVIWLSRATLVAFALEGVAAIRVRGEFRYYLMAGVSGVGVVAWIAVSLLAASLIKPLVQRSGLGQWRWARQAGPLLGLVAVFVLAQTQPLNSFPGFPVRIDHGDPMIDEILEQVPTGDFLLRVDRRLSLGAAQRLSLSLQHHGRHVNVTGRYASHFADRNRQRHSGTPVLLVPSSREPPPSCDVLGTFNDHKVCIALD